jgi:hypothetical protein
MPLLATNTIVKHSPKGIRTMLLKTNLIYYAFLEAALSGNFLSSKEIEFRVKQAALNYKSEVPSARYSSQGDAKADKLIRLAKRNPSENRGPNLKFLRYSVRYRSK